MKRKNVRAESEKERAAKACKTKIKTHKLCLYLLATWAALVGAKMSL